MSPTTAASNGVLVAPERNHFFYGKLMAVKHFDRETSYLNSKRWLLNRLVFGSGVVCGLDVIADPQNVGMVIVQSGVAIDGLGREIVVPGQVSIDPRQLTDDEGNPVADAASDFTLICLAYGERRIDPVPALVADCDNPGKCACDTTREEFHLVVREADPNPPTPPGCTLGEFPLPPDDALQKLLSTRVSAHCAKPPVDACVALARVNVKTGDIEANLGRPLVYGNPLLFELILCLSERVSQLTDARILRYIAGDHQSAKAGDALPAPVVVELVDGTGQPVANEKDAVQFKIAAGAGTVAATNVSTDAAGRAQTTWNVGTQGDPQQVLAAAVGTAFSVTFNATAT